MTDNAMSKMNKDQMKKKQWFTKDYTEKNFGKHEPH